MHYSDIETCDIANGPGVRLSIWVSGCGFHCPGCFNKEAWDPNHGKPFTEETIEYILCIIQQFCVGRKPKVKKFTSWTNRR